MKICILTQPLRNNYGGLLQAYALQTVLKRMGHEVVTDQYGVTKYISLLGRLLRFVYHLIMRYIFSRKQYNPFLYFFKPRNINKDSHRIISKNTNRFINNYLTTIDFFCRKQYPDQEILNRFDCIIVGSDQVWRPNNKYYFPAYFLGFTKGFIMKRIAYAASFGVDTWRCCKIITKKCADDAKLFNAVSVREDTGVKLCNDIMGIEAIQVLDPTFLLEKEDYLSIVEEEDKSEYKKVMMCYVLDKSSEKQAIINSVAEKLDLIPIEIMPKEKFTGVKKNINKCIYPSVSKWISGFRDAEFVVTDSFHGTVFAIIFEKPFVSIINRERGATRFISLLHIFNLENRLISSVEELDEHHFLPINYDDVNSVMKKWQLRSNHFLMSNLSENVV